MTPLNKNVKASKETVSQAYKLHNTIVIGNQKYVPEPPNFETKLQIYKSQVLTPCPISGINHAFMGPTLDPVEGLANFKEFFPTYHRTKPIVSIKEPMNLEHHTSTLRVFRLALPTKKNDDYISWLNKIEAKMNGI